MAATPSFQDLRVVEEANKNKLFNMNKYLIVLGAMLIAMATPIRAQNTTTTQPKGLVVHIMIYSGISDPTFVIKDSAVIAKIMSGLRTLPAHPTLAAQSDTVVPAILGFKGFHIENYSGLYPEIISVSVYGANVELRRPQAPSADGAVPDSFREFHVDSADAPTEALLLAQAQLSGVLDAKLTAQIGHR